MNQHANTDIPSTPTTLFTIRLWTEENGTDSPEWRGKITNLRNQEVRYFRDSETLYGVLVKMVRESNQVEAKTKPREKVINRSSRAI